MSRLLGGFISLFTKKPNNTIVDNLTAKVTRFCSAVTMERERERERETPLLTRGELLLTEAAVRLLQLDSDAASKLGIPVPLPRVHLTLKCSNISIDLIAFLC